MDWAPPDMGISSKKPAKKSSQKKQVSNSGLPHVQSRNLKLRIFSPRPPMGSTIIYTRFVSSQSFRRNIRSTARQRRRTRQVSDSQASGQSSSPPYKYLQNKAMATSAPNSVFWLIGKKIILFLVEKRWKLTLPAVVLEVFLVAVAQVDPCPPAGFEAR